MNARVFVFDGDPVSSRGLAALLGEETDHEIDWFTDPDAALRDAVARAPDALIADCGGAECRGLELARALRKDDPDLAVLALTRDDDADATHAAISEVGLLGRANKPVELRELLAKLDSALSHRALVKKLERGRSELQHRDKALRASRRKVERTEAELESTSIELRTATERLVEAEQLAAVGRVVTGIAHEIGNQLALVGYAEAIKARVDDPELIEWADIIVTAQKRLSSMVSEIRDYASGRLHIEAEAASLVLVVDEALSLLRYDRDIRLRTVERVYEAKPLVSLHHEKFVQVLLNLMSNAALATSSGDTIRIAVDVDPDRKVAIVDVSDRGVGMDSDVLERLGEPFFTTRGDRGSGLGVGICMRIIEDHGGTLTYCSEVGYGTTARIVLPLLAQAAS